MWTGNRKMIPVTGIRAHRKYYKNTENAKAVYYIKQKLYWENIANVPFLGVGGG